MTMFLISILFTCDVVVLSSNNITGSGNYKCADVYCINLDTYFKLDVPTNSIQVTNNIKCKEFFHVLLLKVSIDLDVLQIFEVFYIKFPVSFSMHFGNRYENVNPI